MNEQKIMIEVSLGELVDKITILRIKSERIQRPEQVANINKELAHLQEVRDSVASDPAILKLENDLKEINEKIWEIEDTRRECEKQGSFGEIFVRNAREVQIQNDRRSRIKREINLKCGSNFVEEKSYFET